MDWPFILYASILAVMSLLAFCLYIADKQKAKKGKWRIPEATLLGFSFFGGGLGGYLAMFAVRHKTKHWYFHVVNLLGIAWQTGLFIYLLIQSL